METKTKIPINPIKGLDFDLFKILNLSKIGIRISPKIKVATNATGKA